MTDQKNQLQIQDWGEIPYEEAVEKQLALVEQTFQENSLGYLVFCTHPEVVTTGRGTQLGDITTWDGPTIAVSRGGRATYHGPSQLVIYPILNLKFSRPNRPAQDVVGYLRRLEDSIVEWLDAHYEIKAIGKSLKKKAETESEETGVWVENHKLASLGIAVKKWVTYHGAAINLFEDANAFRGMLPCGFQKDVMISLEKLLANQKLANQNLFSNSESSLNKKLFPTEITFQRVKSELETIFKKNL